MSQDYFEPTLFVKEHSRDPVDLQKTPFFCIVDGKPDYLTELPSNILEVQEARADGSVRMGNPYQVYAQTTRAPEPEYGDQTELLIDATSVQYAPLIATRDTAAAFGLTLIEPGQGIRIHGPTEDMAQAQFEYGLFAGHRSPYQGTGFHMLGQVCTDLEYHDFPHVFVSTDPHQPRVVSVGRFWKKLNTICLADLWLPRGFALYSPSRGDGMQADFLDLHGTRNAALACWPGLKQASIHTHTLLRVKGGYFHWFWNGLPSIHPPLT
ncbi:hypothetical protein E8K88_07275 [Lampropedia aestuarii]|uniref:Uncharacterized protein n=1 Tax=Lampropedia aestuarii TaxID=2562762 RepID=A0A4S5BPS7_9BURK|nr:hypothetical protein [Lampropedia aestuarii]THJ34309.1 hypothetical protein E8K88_07275 [Lampropedia aestuarii]